MIKDNLKRLYSILNYPRVTKAQKEKARRDIVEELKSLNYTVEISHDKGLIYDNYNIITECDNPDLIITAHYDTPGLITSRLFNKLSRTSIYLTDFMNLNLIILSFVLLIFIAICAVFAIVVLIIIQRIFGYELNIYSRLIPPISMLLLMRPIFSKSIYSPDDNTSGVVALLTIAKVLATSGNMNRVKFVLFDNEEKGLKGSSSFLKYHNIKKCKVINLDCVGRGSDIRVVYHKADQKKFKDGFSLVKTVIKAGQVLQHKIDTITISMTDCRSFTKRGIEAVSIMRCNKQRWFKKVPDISWIHSKDDVIEKIDYSKLEEVVNLIKLICQGEKN